MTILTPKLFLYNFKNNLEWSKNGEKSKQRIDKKVTGHSRM